MKKIDRSCDTCYDKCSSPWGGEYDCPGHTTKKEAKAKAKEKKNRRVASAIKNASNASTKKEIIEQLWKLSKDELCEILSLSAD